MALRVLFIDLDDTLCDYSGSVESAAARIFDRAVDRYPHLSPERLRLNFDRLLEENVVSTPGQHARFVSRYDRVRQTLLLDQVEDDELARDLADHYSQLRMDTLTLFPDALPALEALKGRLPLVLVTNGSSDVQRRALERLGIGRYFERIMISEEVGAAKPNPAIFQRALEAVHCRPDEALHVGDGMLSDVAGARAAQVPVAWLNRGDHPLLPNDPRPDYTISSLNDLPPLVEQLTADLVRRR